MPAQKINPWLFRNCHIYRLLLGILVTVQGREAIAQEVQENIETLRDYLEANNIQFTILVLPLLKPYEKWKSRDVDTRLMIIDILERLDIRYFDLFDISDRAFKEGLKVQENNRDPWHPSEEISVMFAKHLSKERLF